MVKKFTKSQLRLLHQISDIKFQFVRGPELMMCHSLEVMGLVEGRLMPAEWDSIHGITSYLRAFRRTNCGKIVCRKHPSLEDKS